MHVLNKIFALSNKERDDAQLNDLRSTILELCQVKPTFGIEVPCTWLKCEVDLQTWCQNLNKKYFTLQEIQEYMAKQIRMSEEQVAAFVRFHGSYGNLILANDSQVIFSDPQYLIDAFRAVIIMRQFSDISKLSLETQGQIEGELNSEPSLEAQGEIEGELNSESSLKTQRVMERELEAGILSEKTLKILWSHMAKEDREVKNLASSVTRFGQFISCGDHSKWIVPALLPPCGIKGSYQYIVPFYKIHGAEPLQYLLYHSPVKGEEKSSAFLPSGFFQLLVESLMRSIEGHWNLEKMFFSAAIFRAGEQSEFIFSVSCHGSVVMLQVFAVEVEKDPPKLRVQFEKAIQNILQNKFPCRHCSVCVSPCDPELSRQSSIYPKHGCLQILGKIGEVEGKPLQTAVFLNMECNQRKHLATRHYERWFNMNSDKLISDKLMRKVAKMVVSWEIYFDLGIELKVPHETLVHTKNENPTSFVEATYNVCRVWDNTTTENDPQNYECFHAVVDKVFRIKLEDIVAA